ncbi:hypothetical protein [Pseudonocardia sp. HH130629-09]|uniref:hypothetical protein n=1 Tax=Pseudonocardia sp. HH130629-09 TaxID=1641402 RepID=UPI000B32AF52|nr:hypothetical protein [Pseudonocardia sp. HH130629-09]
MSESRHLLEGLAGPTVALEAVTRATHEFTGDRPGGRGSTRPTCGRCGCSTCTARSGRPS